MPEKRYLVTPGPTPVPPEVLAATALPMIHHRSADFRDDVHAGDRAAAGRVPDGERRAPLHLRGNRGDGVGSCERLLPRRPRPRRLARLLRRAVGRDRGGLRPATSTTCATSGASCPSADEVGAPPRARSAAPSVVYLTHSDTSTGGVADVQAIAERLAGSGRAHRRRRDLEPGRGSARDRRLGPRHRADQLAQGAHVPGGPGVRGDLAGRSRGDARPPRFRATTWTGSARSPRRRWARRPSRRRSRSSAGSTSRWT